VTSEAWPQHKWPAWTRQLFCRAGSIKLRGDQRRDESDKGCSEFSRGESVSAQEETEESDDGKQRDHGDHNCDLSQREDRAGKCCHVHNSLRQQTQLRGYEKDRPIAI
jgi:hypothetical protein